MFSLNLVDYPMFSLLLATWNYYDLGHAPDTQGTKGMYLDYVGTLRPSKSYGWWGGFGWWPIRF